MGAGDACLLTGHLGFTAETSMGYLMHHIHTLPRARSSLAELPIPPDVDRLILSCLAKDPALRPRSARELSHRLSELECAGLWPEELARAWWGRHQPAQATAGRAAIKQELALR